MTQMQKLLQTLQYSISNNLESSFTRATFSFQKIPVLCTMLLKEIMRQ